MITFKDRFIMKINAKWKFMIALALSLFLLSFSCANFELFKVSSGDISRFKSGYFIIAIVYSIFIFIVGGFKFNLSQRTENTVNVLSYVWSIFGAVSISILFSDGFTGDIGLYLLNLLFYVAFAAVGLLISGSMRVSAITALSVSFVFNCVSFIIYSFRGNSLMPTDFLAMSTAISVASQYKFKLKYQLISATIMSIVHFMIAYKFPIKINMKRKWLKLRLIGLIVALVSVFTIISIDYSGYDVSVYDQHAANRQHGSAVGFYVNATKMGLKQSDTYNPETIDNRFLAYGIEKVALKNRPNIIVIMNESYSDLRAVGDFETNIDYMPYYNSLKKNTIKGEMLVSPFGGYTCNSEYEFLTGMNTGLLSAQSIPYMHMIDSKLPYSLNTHLKQLGYNTIAMHPYYKSGWNRNYVYDYIGFDEFIGLDEFENKEYIRSYVSDISNYRNVLERLYNKEENEREFIFNITMQNHGGYEQEDFPAEVKITSMEGNYPQAEQYLTCMLYSDYALKELLTELKKYDEPVIVAMFGDHQPAVEEEFFEELYGVDDLADLSDEELSKRYLTPFMIWANFDIKEATDVKTSPCFLSNLIMETAKLPKSRVQLYLDDLQAEVSQLNPLGYRDNEGVWHDHDECDELEHYYNIQYSLINGENLNYDFVLYNRKFDIIGDYVLSPYYLFKDESDAIKKEYKENNK